MTIHIKRGCRSKPNEVTGWVEHEYNGNTFIEFIHPTEREREIMSEVLTVITK